jgi:hypothetical protein
MARRSGSNPRPHCRQDTTTVMAEPPLPSRSATLHTVRLRGAGRVDPARHRTPARGTRGKAARPSQQVERMP